MSCVAVNPLECLTFVVGCLTLGVLSLILFCFGIGQLWDFACLTGVRMFRDRAFKEAIRDQARRTATLYNPNKGRTP